MVNTSEIKFSKKWSFILGVNVLLERVKNCRIFVINPERHLKQTRTFQCRPSARTLAFLSPRLTRSVKRLNSPKEPIGVANDEELDSADVTRAALTKPPRRRRRSRNSARNQFSTWNRGLVLLGRTSFGDDGLNGDLCVAGADAESRGRHRQRALQSPTRPALFTHTHVLKFHCNHKFLTVKARYLRWVKRKSLVFPRKPFQSFIILRTLVTFTRYLLFLKRKNFPFLQLKVLSFGYWAALGLPFSTKKSLDFFL